MLRTSVPRKSQLRATLSLFLVASMSFANPALSQSNNAGASADPQTTATPIQHVIVLIGENRSFDHVFATYVPRSADSISNLRSKGIINADGTPGPHFAKARQFQAIAPYNSKYFISLGPNQKVPYQTFPSPSLNFAPTKQLFPPGTSASFLAAIEPSLDADDLKLLTTGAATEFKQTFVQPDPDTRIQNFNNLPGGPFPLRGPRLSY